MYILGLNIGHNATAALLKDGKIVGCVSEERFTRLKNYTGIPFRSIKYLLSLEKIEMEDVNLIVLDDHYDIYENPDFGKQFLEAYTKKTTSKKILSNLAYNFPSLFANYSNVKRNLTKNKKNNFRKILQEKISQELNVMRERVEVIDHHYAHACAVCHNLAPKEKTLVFTLDGEGSGLCATISVFEQGKLRMISKSKKDASIGYLYAIATVYLGMKPLEHEFKVMGLAPYAKEHSVEKVYNKLKKIIWIDKDLSFKSPFSMPFADYFFKDYLQFSRFDHVAGAVQKFTENLTTEWVRRATRKTGVHNIALAGGVFMNVKANQKIAELQNVRKLFVMPSCGDESNAIGCCVHGYKKICLAKNIRYDPKPIEGLYLGPEYADEEVGKFIEENDLKKRYLIRKTSKINLEVARLLAEGNIVARCSGRSEWGARALGNRSILANPSHEDTIRILNETIKDRDFWMPFTPSILDSDASRYIVNPKKIEAPYMVLTFESTPLARKHLAAAIHPYDFTLRPQVVSKKSNPDYYEIIENFKKLTGSGGILNTSFNLHGEPNVLSPKDAIHTIENSALKYLTMGNYLFEKK